MSRLISGHPTILMCPPDHFGIEYEINPWMDTTRPANTKAALAQWTGLYELLKGLGVQVVLMEPRPAMPDLVFTANAGLVFQDRIIVSRFRHAQRQVEVPIDVECFRRLDFDITEPPAEMFFEGAGDALFCGDTLYSGYLVRTDITAVNWLSAELGCRVIPLELVDTRFYHLDTCFCPLDASTAIYFPGAFDTYGQRALQSQIPDLIAVEEEEAARFACNAVVVGKDVVLSEGSPKLATALEQRGYHPHGLPLSEFIKSGGSAKCLTLRLDGEDAARWQRSRVA